MSSENTIVQHIVQDPAITGGKPHIVGTRITVPHIVIWHERMGLHPDEIATSYDISLADVYAALAYYHDNRPQIDQMMREDEQFVADLRQRIPSKLGRMWLTKAGKE